MFEQIKLYCGIYSASHKRIQVRLQIFCDEHNLSIDLTLNISILTYIRLNYDLLCRS